MLAPAMVASSTQTGVTQLQVAVAPVSVQVTQSSKRVRLLVKQARQQWMERQVTEVAVAAENGNLKPLYQFFGTTKNGPKVAVPLFLPSGPVATTPPEVACV